MTAKSGEKSVISRRPSTPFGADPLKKPMAPWRLQELTTTRVFWGENPVIGLSLAPLCPIRRPAQAESGSSNAGHLAACCRGSSLPRRWAGFCFSPISSIAKTRTTISAPSPIASKNRIVTPSARADSKLPRSHCSAPKAGWEPTTDAGTAGFHCRPLAAMKWWAVKGSNLRPYRCKRYALPAELTARNFSNVLDPLPSPLIAARRG